MKTALVIRHVAYEDLAGFAAPVEAAGYRIDQLSPDMAGFATADLSAPDLLVLMGGPMGVYETRTRPWIDGELERLARRIDRRLPTLGVCLGAQMIARAMGANVYAGPVKEVGFAPVELTDAAKATPLRHVAGVPMLHWHGDSFDLPDGTERLASTPAYANQAFRRGDELLALQFHAEMGEDPRFEIWLDGAEAYAGQAGTTVPALRAAHAAHGPDAVAAGRAMMAAWLKGL